MTKVAIRVRTSTKTGEQQVAKVGFGLLVIVAVVIGAISFASLAVGITKAILMVL